MRDSNLIVRSGTAVFVASVPEHAHFEINGTALHGLAVKILISATATGAPTLLCRVHTATLSVAATTDVVIASRTGMTKGAEYYVPFTTPMRAICVLLDQDSSTTTAFSLIAAYITLPNAHDWRRTTEFHAA